MLVNTLNMRVARFFSVVTNMLLQILVISILAGPAALATNLSPVGLWKTIDDHTGKPAV
jgi:hypothetical protein